MQSNTFCVLPWYSHEVVHSRSTPCCLLAHDHDIEQVRQDSISSVRNPACQKCWAIEDSGQTSRRQQENTFLDWKLDRDIEKIEQDCQDQQHSTVLYQIYLSNLCNQACVTCRSQASTKWAEIEKKMGIAPAPATYTDIDTLGIDFARVQRISLVGGEPLFDPRSFHLLERLLAAGNNSCFVSFVTNGSVYLNRRQAELLRSFQNINICFSIDGIGPRFEYLRWPGRWDNLLSNLDQYRTITDNFSVSYTISSINAIYYDETVQWFAQQGLNYSHNIVYDPVWAGLSRMPRVLKQHLQDHAFFKNMISISGNELPAVEIVNQLTQQDQAKKISFQDHLPELHRLLTTLA